MKQNKFLSRAWNDTHLKQIREKAGKRYSPELNVDLPISEIFDGLTRSKQFYYSIKKRHEKLRSVFDLISPTYENKDLQKSYSDLSRVITAILDTLSSIKDYDTTTIPWKNVTRRIAKAEKLSWKLLAKIRDEKSKAVNLNISDKNHQPKFERFEADIHYLYEIQSQLHYFRELSSGVLARLSNTPFLLLNGVAGTGKTHLLCDLVENRLKEAAQLPAILVFGEFFNHENELWKQVAGQLRLANVYGKLKILAALDKAGNRNNCRSLLIIDALNESKPMSFWKTNLNKLVKDIKEYPHVALIVSIRSGFEDQILSKTVSSFLVHEEHRGFRFREWQAVTKFFNEFRLPLPEIPLLMPEFQNPLFLLLFCKAFERKKNTKRLIFQGHEGANYIFEHFVDSVSKRIAKQFNVNSGPGIWDKIIKKVAAEMVQQNNDRVSEEKVIEIAKSAYPMLDHKKLLGEIEKNLLLIKVNLSAPESGGEAKFCYRFPFQKFSDHLIGRYIFKNYRSSRKTAKEFFSKNTEIGKFLSDSWNLGIVEALSIQAPEQLNGVEFFEIAPYINESLLVDAFIQSLIWRRPEAFGVQQQKAIEYINKKVMRHDHEQTKLLNAFLSVASIPAHPMNANFLHRHLSQIPMPKRDAWWSVFLHDQFGEKESVDRLIEWGWSGHDKSHISDDAIKLCCIALTWFLSTSSRSIRDKATKALVELLTNRLSLIAELAEKFKNVDDPYIIERFCAVAYGCVLRNRTDKKSLAKIGQWFYDNVFKNQKPPTHILARDYARGVVETAVNRGAITVNIDYVRPPYGSKWPQRIPSEKVLRKKYYSEDLSQGKNREYLGIWSSVMANFGSLGDFGNYIVNSTLSHWSGRRLGANETRKKDQLEVFKKILGKERLDLFNKIDPFFGIDFNKIMEKINLSKYRISEKKGHDEQGFDEQERMEQTRKHENIKAFKKSLSSAERKYYEKEIEPYLGGGTQINDPKDRFDSGLGQRWIFNRVVQLGWRKKLHGQFDKYVNNNNISRSPHKSERIGKKYQWIAFHEFLALVADNFEFKRDGWLEEPQGIYDGSWQLTIRDIDPSCTLQDDRKASSDMPIVKTYKEDYSVWEHKATHSTWLKTKNDLPEPKSIIRTKDAKGTEWLVLEGSVDWQEEPLSEEYRVPTRRLWYMLKSYLIKKKDLGEIYKWATRQDFYGGWMPESHEFYHVYLGEYPSSPSCFQYSDLDKWTDRGKHGSDKLPGKVMITDKGYQSSGSSIDCSTENSIYVKLPTKLIIDEMKLQQVFTDGRFFNTKRKLVAFDPSVYNKQMPHCLFIRKNMFCSFMKKKGYSILWTLLGEKNMIGGNTVGQPLGWLKVSGVYKLDETDQVVGITRSDFQKSPH